MAMVATGAVVGKVLSLLVDQVLEEVKLLAEGDDRFRGLRSLLSRLREPADYLENHQDTAGETLVSKWLEDLRKELAKAESLVGIWVKIRRWDLRGRHNALKKLIRITESLERLDHSQTVIFASNVRNFGRLGRGVDGLGGGLDRLGEGVDRLGGEVKSCVECLTSEVRSLIVERRELAQATEYAIAEDRRAYPEQIAEIRTKVLGITGSRPNPNVESGPSGSSAAVTPFNDQETFPDEVFGGNDTFDKVIAEIIQEDNYRKCIGLWTMGGAGKTFTAGRVFHDPRVQSYFGGQYQIWVTVSRRSTYSVLKEIFVGLGGWEDDFPASTDVYSVRRALKRQLNLDKFLLVIDDVWEADQLDFIDLIVEPKDFKRRVVLVTTRLQEILDKKHATKIEVSLLSEDDSWKLFSRNAFGRRQVLSELEDVARSVAAECKGLPLALKVIGSTMAGEPNSRMWENALKKLKHALVLSKDHEVQVFGRLQLSVDNLRDRDESDSRLQHCFYYFAAYPEDQGIEPEELAALWTAEGIVGTDPDSPISPDSEAFELLGTLIALSMIEVKRSYAGAVRIHDVMRDLARFNLENTFGKGISKTERIPACQRLCLYRSGLELRTFPTDWTIGQGASATASIPLRVERLSLANNALKELPEQFDAPFLRVLLLGSNRLTSLPAPFFKSFKSLKILDLKGSEITEIPEAVFDLNLLVLLDVGGCSDLREIPDSIGRLQNLQFLHMADCQSMRKVPKSITSLKSLKVLDAEYTFIWDGRKSSETDDFICGLDSSSEDDDPDDDPDDGSGSSGEDDGLGLSNENTAALQDVVLLKSLQSLSVSSILSSPVAELGQLIGLQSLSLRCPRWKELPETFPNLVNLKSLSLYCTRVVLPPLDELQHLEKLYLRIEKLVNLPDSFGRDGAFPSLHTFTMACPLWRGPTLQPGAMPRIKSFSVLKAEKLEFPASFRVLNSLAHLHVTNCNSLDDLSAFEEPNSFPYLKEINLTSSSFEILPAGLSKSAPNLRIIDLGRTDMSRSNIPEDLLEKQRLGHLKIFMRAPLNLIEAP